MLEKICEELGVEIDSEWLCHDGNKYMINEYDGLLVWNEQSNRWENANGNTWTKLSQGRITPMWKPDYGDEYFYPDIDFIDGNDRYNSTTWVEHAKDIWRFNNGLVFKTKESAIRCSNRILTNISKGAI